MSCERKPDRRSNNVAYHHADADDDDWSVVVVNPADYDVDTDDDGSSAAVAGGDLMSGHRSDVDTDDVDTDDERSKKSSAAVDEGDLMNRKRTALLKRKKEVEEELKFIDQALCEGESSDQPVSKDFKPSYRSVVMDVERPKDDEDFKASFIRRPAGPIEGAISSKGDGKMVKSDHSRKRKHQLGSYMDDDEEDSEVAMDYDVETDCEDFGESPTVVESTNVESVEEEEEEEVGNAITKRTKAVDIMANTLCDIKRQLEAAKNDQDVKKYHELCEHAVRKFQCWVDNEKKFLEEKLSLLEFMKYKEEVEWKRKGPQYANKARNDSCKFLQNWLRKKKVADEFPDGMDVEDADREEPELTGSEEDPDASIAEASSQVLNPISVDPATIWYATCTIDPNQQPVRGKPIVGVDGEGCTNVTYPPGSTIESRVVNFFTDHNIPGYPDQVIGQQAQIPKDEMYQEAVGKICESCAIQVMSQTKFVEGCPEMEDITLLDVMKHLWKENKRHFPNKDDVFYCDGKQYHLSKTWKRQFNSFGRVTGYSEIPREEKKGYQRLSQKMYSFRMDDDGNLTVLQQFDFQFRVHLLEKFIMVDRLVILGVPKGYVMDPYEKVWYLVLKHGKYIRGLKKDPKKRGVTIHYGGQWVTLEVSHLDHGVMGLNFLRIESKDMNLCRVVKCFSTINCKRCKNYEIQGNCTHEPICHNTYEIMCRQCVLKLKE